MPVLRRAMLARGMRLAIIAIVVSVAYAQQQEAEKPASQPRVQDSTTHQYPGPGDAGSVTRVFYAAHAVTPQDLTETVNAIRTLADLQRVFSNNAQQAIVVRGTTAQADLAEWLFRELDQPASAQPRSPDSGRREYRAPGDLDFVTRVFYPAHVKTTQGLTEMFNAIRIIADAQRSFLCAGQPAIVLRGTPGQVALVEWLVNALDIPQDGQPATTGRRPSAAYPYPEPPQFLPSGARNPGAAPGDTVVRVFYLAHTGTPQGVVEAINAIRTTTEIAKIIACIDSKAVALRGTPSQDALAEWLLNELDTPAAR